MGSPAEQNKPLNGGTKVGDSTNEPAGVEGCAGNGLVLRGDFH